MRHAILPLSALVLLLWPVAAAADWQVWVERATVKVLPERPAGAAGEAALEAARGEWEGFQLVVRDEQQPITGLDLTLGELRGPAGGVIPLDRTRAYREWLVDIATPSACFLRLRCEGIPEPHGRLPGRYPDPLIPLDDPYDPAHPAVGAPFDVPPATSQALFVDLFVPRDAPAGRYSGEVTVHATDRAPVTVPVTLEVWDFALPRNRTVATSYGFSANLVTRYHGGPTGPGPVDRDRLVRNYRVALHEHLLDETTVNGPVDFRFGEDGQLLPVDWAAYDAAVRPLLDGSYWPDGQPPVRFATGRFEPGSGHGGLSDDQWARAAAALAQHLQERGWLSRAWLYSADEPFLGGHEQAFVSIPADVLLLNTYTDLWRGRVGVTNPLDERLVGAADIWIPVTPMYDDWFYVSPGGYPGYAAYAERRRLGEELWFYVCNANFPPFLGYDVDARLGYEPRLVKWGAYREGATGFLFWRVNYWQDPEPWAVLANYVEFGNLFARQGDGILFYPGDHDGTAGGAGSPPEVAMDGPALSYRMKMIRDGLEDWELFRMTEEQGGGPWVRTQIARAYRRFGARFGPGYYDPEDPPWTLDDQVLHDARRQIAAKLLHLLHPEQYVDPEGGDPPDPEDGGVPDGGEDAGAGEDAGPDAGAAPDGGADGGPPADLGEPLDRGVPDAADQDASADLGPSLPDADPVTDATLPGPDGPVVHDLGINTTDGSSPKDAGITPPAATDEGCGCALHGPAAASRSAWLAIVLALPLLRRRRFHDRRPSGSSRSPA